ncbi:polysaccharide biosynthesis protein [Kribbella flavida DSM 17836]|uniref:Polysaccharide biosynthesis protein n=1 Tax=Kribbella flavida (strain DSM 17836 / JCM 10339 / NBRC 14399) TaxID=479435 RepID=D2PYZ8_KRIFD|nr:lipopolysaccharide biosynthesis protein [Kribbella flavida]ADB31792.1 polysaccharide biosynthesis protein [Kribbella flavida DSM 17836]
MALPLTGTTGPHPASLAKIARGGSANLVGAAGGAVLTLLLTWVVTRGTDATVAGGLFALTAVFLIVAAIAELGSDVSLSKFLPHFLVEDRLADARTTVRMAALVSLLGGGLLGVVLLVLRGQAADVVLGDGSAAGGSRAVAVLAVCIPLAAVTNTVLSATRGLTAIRPTVLVDKIGRALLQVGCVGVAVAAGAGLGGLTLAWALPYVVATLAAIGWFLLIERRLVARSGPGRPPSARTALWREYAAYTWPRVISRISQSILQRADIVLVAALRSPAEAAVYTVATRLFVIGQLGAQAIQQVAAPHTSALLSAGDGRETKRVFQTVTAWTMALTWPFFLACLALAPFLLHVFGGTAYRAGDDVVVVLAVAALLAAAGGPVDLILLMAGRSGLSLVNALVALGVNLVLNLLLIPRIGMVGAAVAWAAAIVVRNVLGMIQVSATLHWLPFSRLSVSVGGLALACFAVPPLLLNLVADPSDGMLVAVLAAGAVGYLTALWKLRDHLALTAFTAMLRRRRHPDPAGVLPAGDDTKPVPL